MTTYYIVGVCPSCQRAVDVIVIPRDAEGMTLISALSMASRLAADWLHDGLVPQVQDRPVTLEQSHHAPWCQGTAVVAVAS